MYKRKSFADKLSTSVSTNDVSTNWKVVKPWLLTWSYRSIKLLEMANLMKQTRISYDEYEEDIGGS